MNKIFKIKWMFIVVLFVSLVLPFNVEAKIRNYVIKDNDLEGKELISGDDIVVSDVYDYIAVDDQKYNLGTNDKVIKFEYYIIDSIDDNGNIKYKKYDFSNSPESVWYPEGYVFHKFDGTEAEFPGSSVVENFTSCSDNNSIYDWDNYDSACKVALPSINGKLARWRFDSKDFGDKTKFEICNMSGLFYSTCTKDADYLVEWEDTYIGFVEYYTSYVYKFYEVPEIKPELKVTCDTNKLGKGKSSKCKINFSYKYALSDVTFDLTSDKLKISNMKPTTDWSSSDTDGGYTLKYSNAEGNGDFKDGVDIATFEVTGDGNINDILASLTSTNFKYTDVLGEKSLSDIKLDFDLGDEVDNPNTFKNSYYLIIGILILGGIFFIQVKSKKKNKQVD